MKINHNLSAVIANKQLLRTENSLTDSLERLSSGLRINRASDDAAGMAIATKMKAQIEGLNQASRNASDGISVVDVIDGALNEVTSMIQRMRELSVQAASDGTLTQEDKEAIQAEIASLTEEIDRISRDTEFNTKPLLDGSLDQRVYPDNRGITRVEVSDAVEKGNYSFNIGADAEQAVLRGTQNINTAVPAGASGKVVINGVEVEIAEGEEFADVYEKLRVAAEVGEVDLQVTEDAAGTTPTDPANGGFLIFSSDRYGSSIEMSITCENADLANYLGIAQENLEVGKDVEISFGAGNNGFSTQATIRTDGMSVEITDRNGFQISFEVEPDSDGLPGTVNLEVTDIGTMTLQIGANENQTVDIRIPEISSKSLYIDRVDVCTVTGADRAITSYDYALSKVSEVRASVGAYQNRLEYAVNSLDGTAENMTAALSRIEDTDMAEEMSEYTKYNVLSQAATSVLAQANDIPQQVLQLLQ